MPTILKPATCFARRIMVTCCLALLATVQGSCQLRKELTEASGRDLSPGIRSRPEAELHGAGWRRTATDAADSCGLHLFHDFRGIRGGSQETPRPPTCCTTC
jgi:hypothetical protein